MLRPFPASAFVAALCGVRAVAVVDQNVSMGKGGILHSEVASALYGHRNAPQTLASYIGGLGGRDIGPEEFYAMARETLECAVNHEHPTPRLMYKQDELREMRKMQAIALVERESFARVKEA